MYLIGLITALLLIYLLVVFCTKLRTKTSTIEAKTKVNNFLKDTFLTETPQQEVPQWAYGISIGIDDFGNAHADVIEHEFDALKKIFSDFSFVGYEYIGNHIAYSFEVDEPLLELRDEEMYSLCLKRCTMMVHHIIHKYNPFWGYTPDLVSIKLSGNQLIIYIAENDAGKKENVLFVGQMRKVLRQQQAPNTTTLEESWNG